MKACVEVELEGKEVVDAILELAKSSVDQRTQTGGASLKSINVKDGKILGAVVTFQYTKK